MNRLLSTFKEKNKNILSIFFTAGYPEPDQTIQIAQALELAGADMLEIGIPYSDPVADGPVIQNSSEKAIEKGMTVKLLFEQLKALRKNVSIPVLLMGYFNPVLQYGVENFCQSCAEAGIDGVIIPDLPLFEYETFYKEIFEKHGISNVFLITPFTSEERIHKIDALSNGFIYLLSAASTTGKSLNVSDDTEAYFARIQQMQLKTPLMIGFGISDHTSFSKACTYANGAIVGTAFVKQLSEPDYLAKIPAFIKSLREG